MQTARSNMRHYLGDLEASVEANNNRKLNRSNISIKHDKYDVSYEEYRKNRGILDIINRRKSVAECIKKIPKDQKSSRDISLILQDNPKKEDYEKRRKSTDKGTTPIKSEMLDVGISPIKKELSSPFKIQNDKDVPEKTDESKLEINNEITNPESPEAENKEENPETKSKFEDRNVYFKGRSRSLCADCHNKKTIIGKEISKIQEKKA